MFLWERRGQPSTYGTTRPSRIPTLLGTAFAGVRNGNVQLHRQWMVRSYALTSVFVTGRVLLAIPAIDRAGEAVTVPALWILLVATLVLTDLGLAWRGICDGSRS
jgi:hypothetical protein